MVDLEKHKVYVEAHKMDMVPYTVAIDAVKQAQLETDVVKKLDIAIENLSKELSNVETNIDNVK